MNLMVWSTCNVTVWSTFDVYPLLGVSYTSTLQKVDDTLSKLDHAHQNAIYNIIFLLVPTFFLDKCI